LGLRELSELPDRWLHPCVLNVLCLHEDVNQWALCKALRFFGVLLLNARALLHICSYQQQGMSYDAAVKTAAAAELSSPSTLQAVSHQFAATGALTPPRTPVDRTSPLHPFYLGESGPPLATQSPAAPSHTGEHVRIVQHAAHRSRS